MKGHEYIREAIRTHLETAVPARLAVHLAANGLTSPDPAQLSFVLADTLTGITDFPVVLIRSTDATDDQRTGDGVWSITYSIEVVVAADHRVHGDSEGASKDRDRVLLAVREAIYSAAGLTDDIDISPAKRPEQTGAAFETRAGVPLAAGVVSFRATVQESLSDLTPTETVWAADVTATGYDASQILP